MTPIARWAAGEGCRSSDLVVSQFEILLAGQLENVQSDSPPGTGGVARRAGVVVKAK